MVERINSVLFVSFFLPFILSFFLRYNASAYASEFHILAMRTAAALATVVGDTAFAAECRTAEQRAQGQMDALLWNEQGKAWDAYTTGKGTVMADTHYAQVRISAAASASTFIVLFLSLSLSLTPSLSLSRARTHTHTHTHNTYTHALPFSHTHSFAHHYRSSHTRLGSAFSSKINHGY